VPDTDPAVSTEDNASGQEQIRTFLIADIRGYTLFTQERGDEAAAKLAAKFADIAREIIEARRGTLLELRGDEALCVFVSTREAIRTAIDLQQRFVEQTLEQPELPLTVGIGLDAGEAVPVQGGYRGAALNLAARLCGQARAGEILATREVTHLARRIEGAHYEDRGSLAFKGISDPVVVVRVVPDGADPVERLRPFAPTAPPKRSSRRWAVGAAVAVAIALTIVALTRGGDDPRSAAQSPAAAGSTLPAGSLAEIDAETGEASHVIRGAAIGAKDNIRPNLAIGEGGVWLYVWPDNNPAFALLQHFDEVSGEEQEKLTIPWVTPAGSGLVVDSRTVWFSGIHATRVYRINPATHEALEPVSIRSGGVVTDIILGDQSLWVGSSDGTLTAFDPLTGRRHDKIEIVGTPDALAYSEGSIWVMDSLQGEIIRVDPVNGLELSRISLSGNLKEIAAGDGGVWVLDAVAGTATPIDPSTDTPRSPVELGSTPTAIAVGLGWAWVSDRDGNLYRIDPELARATPIALGTPLAVVAIDDAGRSVWVGAFGDA
jgi:class 3 adenylate cyclase/outer membrane protein assembly factor BamB